MNFLRSALLTAMASAPSLALAGGGDVFDWINPNGGEYKDPLNWSQGNTPQFDDDARFDIPNAYGVSGEFVEAVNFFVGRSDVVFNLECGGKGSVGCGYIGLDALFIGDGIYDVPRDLDAPGSVTLDSGGIFTGSTILGDDLLPLASRLRFFGSTSVSSTNFAMTPESSIDFNVDATSGTFQSILNLGSGQHTLDGSLFLRPDSTSPPVLGQEILLLGSFYPSSIPNDLLPFRILEPAPLRAFELDWRFDESVLELVSEVVVSDTLASVSLNQTDELGDVPTKLLTTDLDDDGRDDLVVLVDSGVARVYRSLPGGLFDTPVEYPACQNPVDVTAADFDGDGTTDLAIGCEGDSTLLFYLNPNADPDQLVEGPSTTVEGVIRSLAHTEFTTSFSLVSKNGPTVTTRTSSGGGRTKGFVIDGGNAFKIADIEVGDDPGPSDPIDDEQKKDPDGPIGVGGDTVPLGSARGAQPIPALMVLEPTISGPGLEIVRTIPLTGRAVDFATGDLDGDGNLETLVVTENGHLDLVRPELDYPVHSLTLDSIPTSIAIGELRDGGTPEIVIGTSDNGLDFYRVIQSLGGPFGGKGLGGLVGTITLERYAFSRLGEAPTDVAVTAVETSQDESEVIVGLPGGSGAPSVNVNEVEESPVPPCTVADFNSDYEVNALDLAYILGFWGPCNSGPCTAYDLNDDGAVDSGDLGLLFTDWGDCTP